MLGGAAAGRRAFAGVNVSPSLTWKAPCPGSPKPGAAGDVVQECLSAVPVPRPAQRCTEKMTRTRSPRLRAYLADTGLGSLLIGHTPRRTVQTVADGGGIAPTSSARR